MQVKDKIVKRREVELVSGLFDASIDPVLQRIYAARGITSQAQLDCTFNALASYEGLQGLQAALQCLHASLQAQQRILIVGDFDADGATSSALAVSALRALGAQHVDYLVPNRFTYGYGLTPAIVEVARARAPDLIITVDNGIASCDGVAAANAAGIKVIITDHHLPGRQLPEAVAIVNPNQVGDLFPSKNLAGVGVIFYLLSALRQYLRAQGWFTQQGLPEPNMAQFLDLVALGTVADVVPLDQTNRILVQQGLLRIRAGLARPGIAALLAVAKREAKNLVASDLGFALGPRLNAAGRLDDMSQGIACLLSEDKAQALALASQLDALNQERRTIEADMKEQALAIVRDLGLSSSSELPAGLCLFDENWHQGVIGIVAGRLKDRFHRPTIIFAPSQGDELKGSARSIQGVHIRDVLDSMATRFPGLITRFGGHAMAAGLSLTRSKLSEFKRVFALTVAELVDSTMLQAQLLSDGELPLSHFSLAFAETLRLAGPWGQAFPAPLFDGYFDIVSQRIVGQNHLKMTLSLPDLPRPVAAIAFNVDVEQWPNHRCQRVYAAFTLDVNEFNGLRNLQLLIEHLEAI